MTTDGPPGDGSPDERPVAQPSRADHGHRGSARARRRSWRGSWGPAGGAGWGPRARRSGVRPPWWPEGEAWPPQRHGPPRAFGCLFPLLFLVVVVSVVGALGSLLASIGVFGPARPQHTWVAALIVVLFLVAAFRYVGRGLWRTGQTLDELVDAARAVEAGDYSARVTPPDKGSRAVRDLVQAFDTMADRLEADERSRQALLADVSHELRTPLAVIRGSLEAIVDGVHPADEAHLSAIVEETRVMERLVEDLRTLAQAEGGTLALHPEPTDLGDLAGEVVASYASAAQRATVDLAADVPEDVPPISVDPVRIREVVANLVTNALRHTPEGGRVTVRVRPEPDLVVLEVGDTGPGIDPAILAHVFDRFVKTPGSGGSGLGLAIARDLVVAHGGTIDVTSRPGTGTTFTVRLPR